MTELDRSVQLAQLWSALRGVQLQIEDQILPLASQLDLEDRALTIALGEVSKRIGEHFAAHGRCNGMFGALLRDLSNEHWHRLAALLGDRFEAFPELGFKREAGSEAVNAHRPLLQR